MNDYEKYLAQVIPEKDCLKTVKAEAKRFYKTHSPAECLDTGMSLYQSENFQIQETGVLLLGYCDRKEGLEFLRDEASRHPSWKVQEVVARLLTTIAALSGTRTPFRLSRRGWKTSGRTCAEPPARVCECGQAVPISRNIPRRPYGYWPPAGRTRANMSANRWETH